MKRHTAIKDSHSELRLYRQRMTLSLIIVTVLLAVLAYRYAALQLFQYEKFVTQSERNRVHVQAVAPKRGLIFDRNGVLLADNQPSYSLVVVKERVENLDETLTDLQQLFDIDNKSIEKFRKRLLRRTPYQSVPLKFRLTEDEISRFAVNRYKLSGVEIKAQLVRNYPEAKAFTHAVGYVGRINSSDQEDLDRLEFNKVNYAATDHIGKIGIERFYESILHGEVGSQHVETNAHGRVLRVLQQENPVPGQDLVLYLDAGLQKRAAELMKGKRGSIVAIDPRNGGILAMVSTPSYDANPFVTGISTNEYTKLRESKDLPLFNRSLQGQYSPGSTIKPIIGLAGLHHRVISATSNVSDPGWYQLPNDDRLYRDWKKGGHAHFINLHDALTQSCNTFFYDLAFKLGVDRIHEFSAQFGLGSQTGIDSTNERSGLLPSREWKKAAKRQPWFPGETLNIGIGQGYMLATPLQLAVATATIANRGERPVPRLVQPSDGIRDKVLERQEIMQASRKDLLFTGKEDGSSAKSSAEKFISSLANNIDSSFKSFEVSDNYWDQVIDGMVAVVHDPRKGTARAISKGMTYRMAGKSGTAQVIGIAQDAEYDEDAISERQRDDALFIAFAPVENPSVAVVVIVENTGGGSSVAAPIARQVIDWAVEAEKERNQKEKAQDEKKQQIRAQDNNELQARIEKNSGEQDRTGLNNSGQNSIQTANNLVESYERPI